MRIYPLSRLFTSEYITPRAPLFILAVLDFGGRSARGLLPERALCLLFRPFFSRESADQAKQEAILQTSLMTFFVLHIRLVRRPPSVEPARSWFRDALTAPALQVRHFGGRRQAFSS